MSGVVGSSLKMVKFEPTIPNMLQHGSQTGATCPHPTTLQYCKTFLFYLLSGIFVNLRAFVIMTTQQYNDNREKVLEAENNTVITDVTKYVVF